MLHGRVGGEYAGYNSASGRDRALICRRTTFPAFPALSELSLDFLSAWVTFPGGHLLYRKGIFHNSLRLRIVIIVNAQLGPAFNGREFTHSCGEIFVFDPAPDPVSFQDAPEYAYERDVCCAVNRLHFISGCSLLFCDSPSDSQAWPGCTLQLCNFALLTRIVTLRGL